MNIFNYICFINKYFRPYKLWFYIHLQNDKNERWGGGSIDEHHGMGRLVGQIVFIILVCSPSFLLYFPSFIHLPFIFSPPSDSKIPMKYPLEIPKKTQTSAPKINPTCPPKCAKFCLFCKSKERYHSCYEVCLEICDNVLILEIHTINWGHTSSEKLTIYLNPCKETFESTIRASWLEHPIFCEILVKNKYMDQFSFKVIKCSQKHDFLWHKI